MSVLGAGTTVMDEARLTEIEAAITMPDPASFNAVGEHIDGIPAREWYPRAFKALESVPLLITEVRRLHRALQLSEASRGVPSVTGGD